MNSNPLSRSQVKSIANDILDEVAGLTQLHWKELNKLSEYQWNHLGEIENSARVLLKMCEGEEELTGGE